MRHFRRRHFAQGTVLFRKGDPADRAYYIVSGKVRLPEVDIELGEGGFFGELGALANDHRRIASAMCSTDCELYEIADTDLAHAFYESPVFAFGVMRLVVSRLQSNNERLERLQGRT